ncbi:MAG TPA: hypothetical protein VD995_00080 [Azospirillum sp.]|nr:hypothetical protein [Azospirillum sp.]
MFDGLDHALPATHLELLRRLNHAAAGNCGAGEGVRLLGVSRRDVPVTAVLAVTIAWATDVETRAGAGRVRGATFCRNAAELDAMLARELDAETAAVETARRVAALIGAPEKLFDENEPLPALPSMRGPYYVHEPCRSCGGGGVRACANPSCRGGKVECALCGGKPRQDGDGRPLRCEGCGGTGVFRCAVCAGAGVVPCDDCAGVGQFTHIHRPRLVARPARGFALPSDVPDAVRSVLDSVGYDGFGTVAEVQLGTLRHSGTRLLYERVGTVPVITLACTCDSAMFDVDAVGPDATVPAMPAFLDAVLMPLLTRIEAVSGAAAFDAAAVVRVTGTVADAVLAGRAPDLEAIVADHQRCVSRAFVARVAAALQRTHRATAVRTARRAWQCAAGALAPLPVLIAAVDLPALLSGATAEEPAPLMLRALWDIGLPAGAGLGAWLAAREWTGRAWRATFGRGAACPTAQGAWPALVLGAAAALHLGMMTAWHGGLATHRIAPVPELAAAVHGEPLPPPRALSPVERIAAAQRALARLGRYDGAIDGKLGEGTKAGLAGLAGLAEEMPDDPLDQAIAIAADRVAIRLPTPDRLVGPGWSNATRLRLTAEDQPRIVEAFLAAVAAPGVPRPWTSSDGIRSGQLTVTGRVEDPGGHRRPCLTFTHVVTTPAGRDAGLPARACRSAGRWLLEG